MEFGGNKRALEYYKKHNMFKGGNPDHEHPALAAYKSILSSEVSKEIRTTELPEPPKAVHTPKEENPFVVIPHFEEEKKQEAPKQIYSFTNIKTPA